MSACVDPRSMCRGTSKAYKSLGRHLQPARMQVETGSAITWKYPSVVLKGDNSVGEFYSVALTNNYQQVWPYHCVSIITHAQCRLTLIHHVPIARLQAMELTAEAITSGKSGKCADMADGLYRLTQAQRCFTLGRTPARVSSARASLRATPATATEALCRCAACCYSWHDTLLGMSHLYLS